MKERELGVSPATLAEHGAVSAETAAAMAAGVRARLGADVGISVTGIAGPGGGTPEKPVGTVFLHVETPDASRGLEFTSRRTASRCAGAPRSSRCTWRGGCCHKGLTLRSEIAA